MWDPTPWVVTDADISPEMARLVAYTASGGAEGIIEPTDLRVRALSTPGNRVRVAPGGALLKNRYAGGGQQTYALRNATQHNSPIITATGSSGGRTDLVVARVLDPNYEGSAPPDPNDFQYARTEIIEGVPSNTRSALDLNLNFPAIALARINIPSSTATITNSMITDLRHVANPRIESRLFAYNILGSDGSFHLTGMDNVDGHAWPNLGSHLWRIDVPEWATHVQMLGTWSGVRTFPVSGRYGQLWARLGFNTGYDERGQPSEDPDAGVRVDTHRVHWNLDDVPSGGVQRAFWSVADQRPVPSSMRGLTGQPIRMRGRLTQSGQTGTGIPELDNFSSISCLVQFTEGPA